MSDERILFMSAGASIDKTYPITAQYFNPTKVYVIVEKNIFQENKNDTEFLKQEKPKIIQAIQSVNRQVTDYPGREFFQIMINSLNQEEIQAAVLNVRKVHTNAEFCFNITSGTAMFTATLFLMGIWLDGKICITRTGDKEPTIITVPKLSLKDLEDDDEIRTVILKIGEKKMSLIDVAKGLKYIDKNERRLMGTPKERTWRLMEKIVNDLKLASKEKDEHNQNIYSLTENGLLAYHLFSKMQ